jgi:hypothetical protein
MTAVVPVARPLAVLLRHRSPKGGIGNTVEGRQPRRRVGLLMILTIAAGVVKVRVLENPVERRL